MIRQTSLCLIALAAAVAACSSPAKPTLSYIDVAQGAPQAAETEPGRIIEVRAPSDARATYVVQRLRDDSLIEVYQPDPQPLPAGLRVGIRYGSPVRIEAAPTTPDIGPPTPPDLG